MNENNNNSNNNSNNNNHSGVLFRGVFTAIVTPFLEDGSVDYQAYKKLLSIQIKAGVAGIVPIGTTGESPTLSEKEIKKIVKLTIKKCKSRCKVIVGTGSNSTEHTIESSKIAESLGADAVLVVNPYYNKPTQEGLYLHFKAVADSIKIPVMIYNIKGRAAVNLETPTLLRLIKDCNNILAVKEASGDLAQIKDVIAKAPKNFCVLSGDDNITLDLIRAGGHGVVSVVSNIFPKEVVNFVDAALSGDFTFADRINERLMPFFTGAFIETNPIPIKAALAMKGLIKEKYRLPMCEMSNENRSKWQNILTQNKYL
jgi:4-hydroxy-tetrahydrodipicolinate synthase